ncbi:MAG: putative dipeptidase PepE [Anaerolineales bacterium]|nr:putative dipeptidase PepE [Anaerolineales bacterium]
MTEDRLAKLQIWMQEAGIDLIAIGPTPNMRYLLDFAPIADERLCLLLVGPDAVRMVVPSLNAEQTAGHTAVPLNIWEDSDGPAAALREALSAMPAPRRLAVDGAMRADFLLQLEDEIAPQETVDAGALLAPLRQRKSASEIEMLAAAAAQADQAMAAAIEACRPGVTEAEVAWAAEVAFRQAGAEEVLFTLVASGPNGAYPHHHTGQRELQRGDAVVIDLGASLNGYKSDITRMVHLGAPSEEFLEAHEAVHEANQRGRAAVRPGVGAQDVDHAARSVLETRGYDEYFVHRTGHGLGLEIHEPPWIMAGNDVPLAEGMVFSVEPGAYIPRQFGIRIEDIVVVTEAGVRTLTGYDHELVVKE